MSFWKDGLVCMTGAPVTDDSLGKTAWADKEETLHTAQKNASNAQRTAMK